MSRRCGWISPIAVAQRVVERVHRAVALGGAHVALAVAPDLDRGLGLDLAVGALLDQHPPGLQAEQRLVALRLLAHQQLEGAVGGLELEALVLELLDALDDPLGELARRWRVRAAARLLDDRALARELGDEHVAAVADDRRVDVLEGLASARTPAACRPALCANACLPTYGWAGSGERLSSSSTKCAVSVRRARRSGASSATAHLQLQVGDDRDEVGVAGALADAVDRALHLGGAGFDRGERVGDRAAGVVVGVDPERAPAAALR